MNNKNMEINPELTKTTPPNKEESSLEEAPRNPQFEENEENIISQDEAPQEEIPKIEVPQEETPLGVPIINPLVVNQDFGVIGSGSIPILSVSHVSKSYGKHLALSDISLDIYGGRIIGLLGPNGSGKTTLIKLIAGLLQKSSGEILVDGLGVGVHSKSVVSYLPERSHLDENMRVSEAVAYFKDFYADFDAQRATTMLGHLGIEPSSVINSLSKGTKEKVQLILVMSRRARLYLLDEPIGGVDPASRDYILRTIISNYSPDSAVVLSTHLIHDIEQVLDDIIFINEGELVLTSTVDDIREKQGKSVDQLFREVFQC